MHALAKITLSAAGVFTAAGFIYNRQGTHLAELQRPAITDATAAPAVVVKPWTAPPRSARPVPEGRLLDRLEQNLRDSITPEQLAGMHKFADDPLIARLTFIATLTDSEQQTLRARFDEFRLEKIRLQARVGTTREELAAATTRRDTWLQEFLGPERSARWEESESARLLAQQEKAAALALNRVSLAVSLTPEQKDTLHARLLAKAALPIDNLSLELQRQLRFTVDMSEGDTISVPPLQEEVRAILTPEQFTAWQEHTAATQRRHRDAESQLMPLLPPLLTTLQEFVEQKP